MFINTAATDQPTCHSSNSAASAGAGLGLKPLAFAGSVELPPALGVSWVSFSTSTLAWAEVSSQPTLGAYRRTLPRRRLRCSNAARAYSNGKDTVTSEPRKP